jgi:hypothetical protein
VKRRQNKTLLDLVLRFGGVFCWDAIPYNGSMLKMLFVLICLFATTAAAVELQIVETGIGSGTIGSTTFSDSAFTITALANTDNRLPFPGVAGYWFIDHDSTSLSIDNVGTFQILSTTRTYVYNVTKTIGFARGGEVGADLYLGQDAAFSTWDLQTPIGPISTTGTIFEWANTRKYNTPIVTDGGVLIFNDSSTLPETFTATIVPEPASYSLALLALGGFVALAARRIV